MNIVKTILSFLLVVAVLPWTDGQFPRACTNLASLKNKTCCPIPKNFVQPCGSDGNRGTCEELIIRDWNLSYSHFEPFQSDDERHNWPHGLYNRTCKCKDNFGGYDCGKCEFGYYGNNCAEKKTLQRRNFLNLNETEKDRYMQYINQSRYSLSDYVIASVFYDRISALVEGGGDPSGLFYNVSSYDLIVWMHYYSARNTIYPFNVTRTDIDFAHSGQGFPTWHRLYLLTWERILQEIAEDDNFALAYWDWSEFEDSSDCNICSNELFGVTDPSSGIVKGRYLGNWSVICSAQKTDDLTKLCNPNDREIGLTRNTDTDKQNAEKRGFIMTFSTKEEVNFALRFESYDVPPYNKESSCNFRNILEGFSSSKTGYRLPNVHTLHNRVHIVIGGVMGYVPSAANDPIFHLHHAFVDRIYEKWLRKFKKDSSVLSQFDAPLGHNKKGVIVPIFPVYTHEEMFGASSDFGYEYEGDMEDNFPQDNSGDDTSLGDCPVPCNSGVSGMWFCSLLSFVIPLWQLLFAN